VGVHRSLLTTQKALIISFIYLRKIVCYNTLMNRDLEITKALVGESITRENLRYVDCYIYEKLSIYTPIGGHCGYAVSPNHTHPSYMFSLPYDGETAIMIKNKKIETEPNTLLALSPYIEHSEIQDYLLPKYSAIIIDKVYFEKHFSLYTKDSSHFEGLTIPLNDNKLNNLINEFKLESEENTEAKEILLASLSTMITHHIIRTILGKNHTNKKESNHLAIDTVVNYINTNFSEDISVDELATLVKLSKSYLTKLFTKEMDISPMEYLKRVRLQHAKKLLLKPKLSITAIATQCGFNSSSYFTKSFKELYRETPKEFALRSK
jgi:AraC-like DNA-binding protein